MSMFGDVIKSLRNQKKLTQSELAHSIGLSQSYYSKLEKKEHEPTADTILVASKFFNVSTDYILTGQDTEYLENELLLRFQNFTEEEKKFFEITFEFLHFLKFKNESLSINNFNDSPTTAAKEETAVYLPILGNAAAGTPIEIIELPQGDVQVNGAYKSYNSFVIRAQGDSMKNAGIKDNDLVIVKAQPTVENGEIALVNVDGSATIKYFYLINGQCELRPANPKYNSMFYTYGNITILGKVLEVIK